MSKWKCGICGSEFENYHAQGFDDIIYCPLCYFKEIYKREQKKTKLLQNQLQQKDKEIERLNNIINKLEKHCETMLSIFEQMTDEQRQEQLDKYKIYDVFLRRIQELKGSESNE